MSPIGWFPRPILILLTESQVFEVRKHGTMLLSNLRFFNRISHLQKSDSLFEFR